MQQCPKGFLVAGWLALAFVAACSTDLAAQDKDKDKSKAKDDQAPPRQVDIVTVDKVELKGKFYPSKTKDATCVLLLHALGESSDNKEWINFAKKLQEKGYAVLTFDFRGHGESTTVQPGMPNLKNPQLSVKGFWDERDNAQNVKGYVVSKPRPTEIKYENFSFGYWTYLCNDIAAAKAFLDDQPDVNSNNLILIGAKDGATLGALWLNSEFHRFKNLNSMQPIQFAKPDVQNPEGQAVAGCVWLTMSATAGPSKNSIDIRPMLETPAKLFKVPMYFLYGQGDDKGKTVAVGCEKYLATGEKDKKLTGAKMIEKAEKSTGKDLLLYDAAPVVIDYLEMLPPSKAAKAARPSGQEAYVWTAVMNNGRLQPLLARDSTAKLMTFSSYTYFFK